MAMFTWILKISIPELCNFKPKSIKIYKWNFNGTIYGFSQDCSISSADALEILQYGTVLFSAANLALAGVPLTNALGENLPSRR